MGKSEFPPRRYWLRKWLPRMILALAPGIVIFAGGVAFGYLPPPWNIAAFVGLVLMVAVVALAWLEIDHYRAMRRLGAFDRDGNRTDRGAA